MKNKIYFENLDTLRFAAFFLVFWQHTFSNSFRNISENNSLNYFISKLPHVGGVGVHIFFVLSGFLITFLMLKEKQVSSEFNLKFFYIRRVLRIWPLYYIVLILGIFILPNVFSTFNFNGDIIKNLIFLNNFDNVHVLAPNIGIAWSVAIEEQFYLIWPLIFILIRSKKVLILFCSILYILSIIFNIKNPDIAYFHTFGNISYLMIGCLGAIIYSEYNYTFINTHAPVPVHLIRGELVVPQSNPVHARKVQRVL